MRKRINHKMQGRRKWRIIQNFAEVLATVKLFAGDVQPLCRVHGF